MADEMLFWPGATVELGDDPVQAGEQVLDLLRQEDALAEVRRRNVRHMLLHHDWRDRIRTLCRLFALPVPDALVLDIGRVQAIAERFA
jgi:hypothetical protein